MSNLKIRRNPYFRERKRLRDRSEKKEEELKLERSESSIVLMTHSRLHPRRIAGEMEVKKGPGSRGYRGHNTKF